MRVLLILLAVVVCIVAQRNAAVAVKNSANSVKTGGGDDTADRCFSQAVGDLRMECGDFDDDSRKRTVLAVTNCFLRDFNSSLPDPYPCPSSTSYEECVKNMLDRDRIHLGQFTAQFVTFCRQLRLDHIARTTQQSLESLYQASNNAKDTLATLHQQSSDVQNKVGASLDAQERLSEAQERLEHSVNATRDENTRNLDKLQASFQDLSDLSKSISETVHRSRDEQAKLADLQGEISQSQTQILAKANEYAMTLDQTRGLQEQLRNNQVSTLHTTDDLQNKLTAVLHGISESQLQLYLQTNRTRENIERIDETLNRIIEDQHAAFENLTQVSNETLVQVLRQQETQQDVLAGMQKIQKVQQEIVDSLLDISSVAYWTGCGVGSVLLTTTRRTKGARAWLLLGFTALFVLEKLVSLEKVPDALPPIFRDKDSVWLVRRWAVGVALGVLALCSILYTDDIRVLQSRVTEVTAICRELERKLETTETDMQRVLNENASLHAKMDVMLEKQEEVLVAVRQSARLKNKKAKDDE